MADMVKVENLCKNFGDFEALKNINLTVREGEKLVIIGPSGSGKSTLIRCINYLEEPTSGKIFIGGQEVTRKNHREMAKKYSAMVFQQFNLYPHLTVMENLTLAPMKLQHVSKKEAEEEAMRCLKRVGLEEKANVYPNQLSGGQQQRVAIARAMCNNPAILLADEPTGALDQKTGRQVMELFHKINDEGKTIIMITHDANIAAHAKRIVRILDGNIGEGDTADA